MTRPDRGLEGRIWGRKRSSPRAQPRARWSRWLGFLTGDGAVLLSAHTRSRRTRGLRPAPELCGSQERPSNRRWVVPCIHENALLLVDGLDDGRAEDAAGLAGGESQVLARRTGRTCVRWPAVLRSGRSRWNVFGFV